MASNTPAGRNSAPSIISANLHIVGNLKTDGEIQIDGVIEGDVTAQALTIGGSARVSGELTGQEVIVHGQIFGKITSKNVRLAKTAQQVCTTSPPSYSPVEHLLRWRTLHPD